MEKLYKFIFITLTVVGLQSVVYAQQWQYQVEPGDNLWTIADQYLIHHSYVRRLQKYNDIANPLVLQPGQIIKSPVHWLGNLPSAAQVVSVSGSVELDSHDGGAEIVEGYELSSNDQITTGQDGFVRIRFSDNSILQVDPNAQVAFTSLKQSYDGSIIKVRLDVERGRVNVDVSKDKEAGHRLEIESPSAVTAVRGTKFRVGVSQNSKDTVAEVLHGKVAVSGANQTIVVKQHYGTKVGVGDRPLRPKQLLDGPQLTSSPLIEGKLALLDWNDIDGAEGYRLQIAHDEAFTDVFYEQRTAAAKSSDILFDQDGNYYISLRAIDQHGIEGKDEIAKIEVNARPEPPLIISPQANSRLFDSSPDFSWAMPASEIKQMRFQLASNEQFSDLLIDQTLDATDVHQLERSLSDGDYYWRVANIDASGQGPFSKPMKVSVLSQPDLASSAVISKEKSEIKLALTKDGTISRYRVQVARDSDFDEIIFDDWVSGDEFAFATEGAGSYYVRLGVESETNEEVDFSEAQKIIVPYKEWGKVMLSFLTGLLIAL